MRHYWNTSGTKSKILHAVSQKNLKFEEFFNLQSDEKTTHTALERDIQEDQNEDGPDSVSYRIKFNRLAALKGRK